jgi:hypothetical protein
MIMDDDHEFEGYGFDEGLNVVPVDRDLRAYSGYDRFDTYTTDQFSEYADDIGTPFRVFCQIMEPKLFYFSSFLFRMLVPLPTWAS